MPNINGPIVAVAIACTTLATSVLAQNQPAPSQAPPPGGNAPTSATQASSDEVLKPERLQQLVSPIALYSDNLLAQVLIASTYPLEVVEASRWLTANKNLKGDALKSAVDKEKWDDSVKGLIATPQVLDMMSNKLSWTKDLGDAVLAQQADVMEAVQALRARAQTNKKLETTKEQKVSTKTEANKQLIVIESAAPNTVYVPYYNPSVVYGAWPYPAYPPYYYPPYGYYPMLGTGVAFAAGVALGAWAGRYWGGGVGWGNNTININNNFNRGNWNHNPAHRQGIRYNNSNVAKQFGRGNQIAGGAGNRNDFRGRGDGAGNRPGAGTRPGGGDRPGAGAGNRPGGGDRPGAGNRPGGGGSAGNRPGGGDRPSAGSGNRPSAGGGQRPSTRPSGGGRDNAFSGGSGRATVSQSARGHSSMGSRGGASFHGGGGGGGFRGGGGGGGGRGGGGGGGRRSDLTLKHDITLLGQLDSGLGFYRFSYNGAATSYVGVIAQEVQSVTPEAVSRGSDGYLRVRYEKLGVKFQTYEKWIGAGAVVPHGLRAN
jgi:hypothetical protein